MSVCADVLAGFAIYPEVIPFVLVNFALLTDTLGMEFLYHLYP